MASIKVIRTELRKRNLNVGNAEALMGRLRAIYGSGWTQGNLSNLLDTPSMPSFANASIAAPVIAPPVIMTEKPDYFENPNGTFQCNHCDHKPYKREHDCIRHIENKHADLLED